MGPISTRISFIILIPYFYAILIILSAIFSAILKDAPILVCDEATSALDGATERQIIDTLRSISHDRTTIVIAHRLSTVQHADLIIVLNEGKVAEVGSPKELLRKKDSLYSVMWQKQQQQDREALYATTADKVDDEA